MFAKRAMLVELTIRQWTARKHDKSASNTVKNAHQVAGDGGKYNKLLIAKEALERINRVANELRRTHYRFTAWTRIQCFCCSSLPRLFSTNWSLRHECPQHEISTQL